MGFRKYLLNEDKQYLGQKVGTLLAALENLDSDELGNKALMRQMELIVNQIRHILHGEWLREDRPFLKKIQKVGVALAKAIDEKDNIKDTIRDANYELRKLTEKLGVPINKLG